MHLKCSLIVFSGNEVLEILYSYEQVYQIRIHPKVRVEITCQMCLPSCREYYSVFTCIALPAKCRILMSFPRHRIKYPINIFLTKCTNSVLFSLRCCSHNQKQTYRSRRVQCRGWKAAKFHYILFAQPYRRSSRLLLIYRPTNISRSCVSPNS